MSTQEKDYIHARTATEDTDLWETCIICEQMTDADPREIYVRDPTVGRIEAKAHVCESCLEDKERAWRHNKHQ